MGISATNRRTTNTCKVLGGEESNHTFCIVPATESPKAFLIILTFGKV